MNIFTDRPTRLRAKADNCIGRIMVAKVSRVVKVIFLVTLTESAFNQEYHVQSH